MNTIPQPSVKSLILSCILSTLLAIIILFVAVLPAEFDIDPTGLGEKFGLTVLSQTADTTAKPTVISCPDSSLENKDPEDKQIQTPQWKDTVIITIPAKKGLEYKFYISKGETLEFDWNTNGEKLYFDFHGEPEGDKTGYFKSFKESTQSQSSGTLSVPFTGSHGWYWENKTNQAVTIILKTRGNYKIIGLI
ncbi:MAG: hypothetical protein KAR12_06060 [Methylococcales bacterium]|nr:hypothetical protein [Methylococcales bacterium]